MTREDLAAQGASEELIEACQILLEDKMPEEKVAALMLGCVKLGKDPVKFAKHVVGLRQDLREFRERSRA